MAKVANPAKEFQFNIIIQGFNPFLVQTVKSPDMEFEVAEHGDTDRDIKTAGRKKVGMVSIERIFDATKTDTMIRNWQKQISDGALPSVYKKPIVIEQLAPDGITVINRWLAEDCWPQKRNGVDFKRRGSDNTIESVEFSCDDCNQV